MMEKIVGQFDKCDECEALVDVYIEFYSRRGDMVKVCMNCMYKAITEVSKKWMEKMGGSGEMSR